MMKFTFSDYDRIRDAMLKLIPAIVATIPKTLVREEFAKISSRADSMQAQVLVLDSLVYAHLQNGKNRAGLFLSRQGRQQSAFEQELLLRMSEAQFRLLRLHSSDETGGISVTDLIDGRDYILRDRVLVTKLQDYQTDILLATQCLDCDDFIIGTGGALQLPEAMLEVAPVAELVAKIRANSSESARRESLAELSRLSLAIWRLARNKS